LAALSAATWLVRSVPTFWPLLGDDLVLDVEAFNATNAAMLLRP
jgi:hypothetical protein